MSHSSSSDRYLVGPVCHFVFINVFRRQKKCQNRLVRNQFVNDCNTSNAINDISYQIFISWTVWCFELLKRLLIICVNKFWVSRTPRSPTTSPKNLSRHSGFSEIFSIINLPIEYLDFLKCSDLKSRDRRRTCFRLQIFCFITHNASSNRALNDIKINEILEAIFSRQADDRSSWTLTFSSVVSEIIPKLIKRTFTKFFSSNLFLPIASFCLNPQHLARMKNRFFSCKQTIWLHSGGL